MWYITRNPAPGPAPAGRIRGSAAASATSAAGSARRGAVACTTNAFLAYPMPSAPRSRVPESKTSALSSAWRTRASAQPVASARRTSAVAPAGN
jgi:hypothetical protein